MKLYCILLFVVALNAQVHAQSEAATNAPSQKPPTQIYSDTVDFNLKTHIAIYRGNVRVEDPQMRLWCLLLTATAPSTGGRIEKIVAETNVVMLMPDDKGQTNRATGEKLVYTYNVVNGVTNELAVLTGNPKLEKPDTIIVGDVISWDRANDKLHVVNQSMVFKTPPEPAATNPPPAVKKSE